MKKTNLSNPVKSLELINATVGLKDTTLQRSAVKQEDLEPY